MSFADRIWPLFATGVIASCGSTGHPSTTDATAADAVSIDAPFGLHGVETYIKASNPDANDRFGFRTALSGDGQTLVVGAPIEASQATGIDGDQTDNSKPESGAVYVFTRTNGNWAQQAYLKASNTDAADHFGWSVAVSADGNLLAVGAPHECSCATGVGGLQQDNACGSSGAAYVFQRTNQAWSQQAYVKSSNPSLTNCFPRAFGDALALSNDGSTLAIGGPGDCSGASGINGDQTGMAAPGSGAVYVFTQAAGVWSQQAYVKASNPDYGDGFGGAIALSDGGDVMAVGAPAEASGAAGIDGDQLDNSKTCSGAVYMFHRNSTTWQQDAYVKASNPDHNDEFGNALALSGDGKTLGVGAYGEASAATGVDGDQTDNSQYMSGAVYVFSNAAGWAQQAYLKEERALLGDSFGMSVALSNDGNVLVTSAPHENGRGSGLTTLQPTTANASGAVYLFTRAGATWSQLYYLKASNAESMDEFGSTVTLSSDASSLAVGAEDESSASAGVGGNQADNTKPLSGAAYLVR